jgi:glycerol-3-phosphate acyltransferase PlsY
MAVVLSCIGIIAIGYLIGSIPTANIMMQLFRKQDLRELGTGNVTSTAVILHGGRLPGALSLMGEIAKTFACIFVAHFLVGELWSYLVILVAASLGQMWSVWLGGAGGMGQTIFATGFLILCPVPFLLSVLCFTLLLFTTKRFYLSNQLWHLIAPIMLMLGKLFNPTVPTFLDLGHHSWGYAVTGAFLCLMFLVKNRREADDILQMQAWGEYSR